jgi:hypothetical protein
MTFRWVYQGAASSFVMQCQVPQVILGLKCQHQGHTIVQHQQSKQVSHKLSTNIDRVTGRLQQIFVICIHVPLVPDYKQSRPWHRGSTMPNSCHALPAAQPRNPISLPCAYLATACAR